MQAVADSLYARVFSHFSPTYDNLLVVLEMTEIPTSFSTDLMATHNILLS